MATWRPVKRIQIMMKADNDHRAEHAVIAFPDQSLAYAVETPQQLKAIIEKLQVIYNHLVAKGESKIVSFDNRF